jgi:uncharacterized repeat protein (TIGR03803 family)
MRFSRFAVLFLLATVSLTFAQTVSTVLNFNGTNGANPLYVSFVQGRDARLYGTTYSGGANGLGAVIRINLTTKNSVILHSFDGTNGSNPGAGLTLGTDGNYYGTTVMGGSPNLGVLYKISPAGTYTVLHQFAGGSDGNYPYGPPILASDGNFYGATSGTPNSVNATIYKYTSGGVYSVIYTFDQSTTGVLAYGLTQGTDGLLYTTTNGGGAQNSGTLVKLTTSGVLKQTHTFNGANDGNNGPTEPIGAPMQASDGNFYGTTQAGGTDHEGTLYQVTPIFGVNVPYNFGINTGSNPSPGLIQASDGKIYGVTSAGGANIYSWSLTGGGYTSLSILPPGFFIVGMTQDTSGVFYGASWTGGPNNDGYLYSFDMGLGPFIAFVKAQGKVGATAQILGQGFTGTTAVTFNGVPATFSVVSDTYMTALVPSGATTGPVVATTPAGTRTSNKSFRVTP